MTSTTEGQAARLCDGLHHGVLALLVVSRPLIWDGEPGSPAALAWYALVAVGLVVLGGEFAAGLRRAWTWSPLSFLALLAGLLLVPGGLHSPQAFAGLSDLGQLLGHLAFGVYCSQVVTSRERTAIAALLAGLAVEACYALGQQALVLPALERAVLEGQELASVAPSMRGDLTERLRNGGVYGTFTLSNALAAYLLLAIPLAIGAAASRIPPLLRIAAGVAAVLGLATLACTNSKGAWAAAIVACGVVALRRAPGWWRWAVPGAVAVGIAVALVLPALRAHLQGSADVRLGYWQAATSLIAERPLAGYGVGGFAAEAPRTLPIGAEYSRHVHNEVLEAGVAGGVPAALVVAACFAVLLLRRSRGVAEATPDAPAWLPIVIGAGLIYLHVFGLLPAGGFPGCESDFNLVFIIPFALLAAGAMALLRRVTVPPWAVDAALAAVVLHCLLDFDLRSGGVLGTLVVVACLGASGRAITIGRAGALAPLLAAGLVIAGLSITLRRATELGEAQALTMHVQALARAGNDSDKLKGAVDALHVLLDLPEAQAADLARRHLVDLRAQAMERAWAKALAAPAPAEVLIGVLALEPPSRERLARSTIAVAAFPHSSVLHGLLAEDLAANGQWPEALATAREAVRRAPWRLIHRKRLADLLERYAESGNDPALRTEAEAERQRIIDLQPQVYFRDRLPEGAR